MGFNRSNWISVLIELLTRVLLLRKEEQSAPIKEESLTLGALEEKEGEEKINVNCKTQNGSTCNVDFSNR